MRRTRGDIRLRRRALVRVLEVFFAAVLDFVLDVFLDAEDFSAGGAGSAVCPAAWLAACCERAKEVALSSPPARASIREYLRQNETTLIYLPADPKSRTCFLSG
jgi:hypothetical protein